CDAYMVWNPQQNNVASMTCSSDAYTDNMPLFRAQGSSWAQWATRASNQPTQCISTAGVLASVAGNTKSPISGTIFTYVPDYGSSGTTTSYAMLYPYLPASAK